MMEASAFDHCVLRYDSYRLDGGGSAWSYMLSNPRDIEEYHFNNTEPSAITKMCLARMLQLKNGWGADRRIDAWGLCKDALLAGLADSDKSAHDVRNHSY